jgi:hypothetical protein
LISKIARYLALSGFDLFSKLTVWNINFAVRDAYKDYTKIGGFRDLEIMIESMTGGKEHISLIG